MRIIITGANGFLGQHLCKYLFDKNYKVFALSRGNSRIPSVFNISYYTIDLTDKNAVLELINKLQPDVIVHTAAMSKPDECNVNRKTCLAQNVGATSNLLEAALNLRNSPFFIHASTDFVLGEGGPHAEDALPDPMNFYGQTKLEAEKLVQKTNLPICIIRPGFIYGPAWEGLRPSFLHWVKSNLEQRKRIKVVGDQLRTPVYVGDLCKATEQIFLNRKTGIYHLAGKDIVSPYQMAIAIAKALNLESYLIEEVSAESFPEPVQRAKHAGLVIEKAIAELNYTPISFQEGVKLIFVSLRQAQTDKN